jgi:phage-related holin
MMFIVIATAVIIQGVIGDAIPLREIVIMFFICNEGISLLENASEFVDIPEPLKDALIQLRDKNNGEV